MADGAIEQFWDSACHVTRLTQLPGYLPPASRAMLPPPAFAFGATPAEADAVLARILAGEASVASGTVADYEAAGEPQPQRGGIAIVLDGAGHPRALVETIEVAVVPLDQLDAEVRTGLDTADLAEDAPVVVERFLLVYPT